MSPLGGANFSQYMVFNSGQILMANDLNNSFQQILINLNAAGIASDAPDVATLQATQDPTLGTLYNSLEGDIQRLRFQIKVITGGTYWYTAVGNGVLAKSIWDGTAQRPASPTPGANTVLVSGAGNTIDPGFLGSGTPSSSTVLYGNRTWSGIPHGMQAFIPYSTLTCTVTIASPAVITLNNHGYSVNDTVVFATTGALPTGITAGTVYYVISAGLTANNFEIATTRGGGAINTSGSQSGTQSVTKTGGDWTAPITGTYFVLLVGSGGGGGGGAGAYSSNGGGGGGGGGSAGEKKYFTVSQTANDLVSIVAGPGGTAGSAGAQNANGGTGGAGILSSYGSISAIGGSGGGGGTFGNGGSSGTGASAVTGNIVSGGTGNASGAATGYPFTGIAGGNGGSGSGSGGNGYLAGGGGGGASAEFGAGGNGGSAVGGSAGGAGSNGTGGSGGGGGGGGSGASASGGAGGVGGGGLVVIWW